VVGRFLLRFLSHQLTSPASLSEKVKQRRNDPGDGSSVAAFFGW
jgi:hypothetical protein